MNVKELKEILKDIPDDVDICVSDMNGEDFEFSVGTYWDDAQTYLEFIIPIYIHAYNYEGLALDLMEVEVSKDDEV